jgi:hypothetical protein
MDPDLLAVALLEQAEMVAASQARYETKMNPQTAALIPALANRLLAYGWADAAYVEPEEDEPEEGEAPPAAPPLPGRRWLTLEKK